MPLSVLGYQSFFGKQSLVKKTVACRRIEPLASCGILHDVIFIPDVKSLFTDEKTSFTELQSQP